MRQNVDRYNISLSRQRGDHFSAFQKAIINYNPTIKIKNKLT